MTFDAPVVVAIAPLVGGATWFAAVWARRMRLRRAARWSDDAVRRALEAGRYGPTALCAAAFLATVALAGPRWGNETVFTETRGLDVVLAVDVSRSMLAEDAGGASRLARAVREARRLVQDRPDDRIGLVAFAGAAYVLSPLTVDGSAVTMYLDALDPDVVSAGGTSLGPALATGNALVGGASDLSDRVLVVFTDGEPHDSMPDVLAEAERLERSGVHLILVAEGGKAPARIPLRDDRGALIGWQRDEDSTIIATARRDDVLSAVADAAQGTIVAAELPDQAGAVRDLLSAYTRARASASRTERGRPRAWLPLLIGAFALLGQAARRRAASLIGLVLLLGAPGARAQASPARPRTPPERAWDRGDTVGANTGYADELTRRQRDDTAYFNAGTAALVARDFEAAQSYLTRAAASLDPELRFRALYNLGVVGLEAAARDSTTRDAHLTEAERALREALLLKPHHLAAKWNLELATRRHGGGGQSPQRPPPSGGGGGSASSATRPSAGTPRGRALSPSEADEILKSIGQDELRARRDKTGRPRREAQPYVKDW
ncbi:MAG TPA: VWA domain-containing protein [Gemmatimonadales bacterium]